MRLLLLALLLCACGSTAPSRFYALEPLAAGEAPVGSVPQLTIGPVTLPKGLDRSEIVTRLAPFELGVDEYARWTEPLDRAVARVLGTNLGALLDASWVATLPGDNAHPDAPRVSVQVLRFEADAERSTLEARWQVWSGKPGAEVTRKSTCVAERKGDDAASIAAAMSENLAQLAREIAEVAKGTR